MEKSKRKDGETELKGHKKEWWVKDGTKVTPEFKQSINP